MIITGGTGNGYAAKVTAENRLETIAITASNEHHANHDHGTAFNMLFDQAPTAGDDCIIFIQNTDDVDMCIEGVWLSVSGACEVYGQLGDTGTRNAATGVIPANLNAGSGNTADGTFEVGADLDGGAATLAGGVEFQRYVFRAATDSSMWNFEQDIIVPKNATFTFWCSAIVTITGAIVLNYHTLEGGG